jgi:DNA-binding MarR family transcriptional regulator
MYTDKEYLILEHINDNSSQTRQRDLAAAADLSLGMTNAVLKKLVSKGFLVMKRVNSRNIHYAITPEGLKHIARRSRELLKRTLSNVAWYRDATERYVKELKARGVTEITLQGPSDLDFILEWACMKNGLLYLPALSSADTEPGIRNQKQKVLEEQELLTVLESYTQKQRETP